MRALLLAAGLGTRLRPLTDTTPKCLVPIKGKPLLDIWCEALLAAGVTKLLINLHYKSEQVQQHLESSKFSELVETIFDTLNAKAALFAIEEVKEERNIDIPIMVSGTITDASGRTLSGQTVEAFLASISHIPLLSVGFNCALGAEQLKPYLQRLSNKTEFNTSAHPNAGLPNAFGEYDQSPKEMQKYIEDYLQDGLINIIGGCCGTNPEHIKAIAEVAQKYKPRTIVVSV